jgi:hypothetical protein
MAGEGRVFLIWLETKHRRPGHSLVLTGMSDSGASNENKRLDMGYTIKRIIGWNQSQSHESFIP